MRRIARHLLRLDYLLRQRTRHNRLAVESFDDFDLIVLPEVMNPRIFLSGDFFSQAIEHVPITARQRVLDMGCGSGIMALSSARRTQHVVALDINPHAVRCTKINALLNGLENCIDVLQSDLFSAVANSQFDLILFNPPFFRGVPEPGFDQAWRSPDVVERFARQLHRHLAPGGAVYLLLSSEGDSPAFLRAFEECGYCWQPFTSRRFLAEIMTIYHIAAHGDH